MKNDSSDVEAAGGKSPPGATGRPTPPGAARVIAGAMGGKVLVGFGRPVSWVGLDTTQARILSVKLWDLAAEADGNGHPPG